MFVGNLYSAGHASNTVFSLNEGVEIVNISLAGGGSDVVFDRLTGETNQNGSFVIRLKSDNTASTTLTLYGTGIIETN